MAPIYAVPGLFSSWLIFPQRNMRNMKSFWRIGLIHFATYFSETADFLNSRRKLNRIECFIPNEVNSSFCRSNSCKYSTMLLVPLLIDSNFEYASKILSVSSCPNDNFSLSSNVLRPSSLLRSSALISSAISRFLPVRVSATTGSAFLFIQFCY